MFKRPSGNLDAHSVGRQQQKGELEAADEQQSEDPLELVDVTHKLTAQLDQGIVATCPRLTLLPNSTLYESLVAALATATHLPLLDTHT